MTGQQPRSCRATAPFAPSARTRDALRRAAAATLGIGILAAALFAPAPEPTLASWSDAEHAGDTLTALTVPTPEVWGTPSCTGSYVVLLGASITLKWRVPAGYEYTASNAEFALDSNGLLDPLTVQLLGSGATTGTPSGYTTTVSSGLLSGLLGRDVRLAVRFKDPSGWTSDWLVATVPLPAIAGTVPCTFSTFPRDAS